MKENRYTKMLTNQNERYVSKGDYVRWVFNDPSISDSKAAVWMAIAKSNDVRAMKRCKKDIQARLKILNERESRDDGYETYRIQQLHSK